LAEEGEIEKREGKVSLVRESKGKENYSHPERGFVRKKRKSKRA
jgi:hypothetical protein